MKSKCCNKPLRLSRENPEPGETMYYICDGCNQPADPKCDHSNENELTGEQLHADDYVDKNYHDEKEVLTFDQKLRIGAIKCKNNVCENDPTCGLPDHLFCMCENGTPCFYTCFEFKKYVDEKVREERAEERNKVIEEIEAKILDCVPQGWCTSKNEHKIMDSDLAIAIQDLIKAKLNQLKGGE